MAEIEAVTIQPSPPRLLRSPPAQPTSASVSEPWEPTPAPPKSKRRPSPPSKPAAAHAVQPAGLTKRKQSKSRNGCITCKAKRLKCDETKPTCQQCARRSVTCGGYKKDFKWRPFEEASFVGNKPAAFTTCSSLRKKKASPANPPAADDTHPDLSERFQGAAGKDGHHSSSRPASQSADVPRLQDFLEDPSYLSDFAYLYSNQESDPLSATVIPVPPVDLFDWDSLDLTDTLCKPVELPNALHSMNSASSSVVSETSPEPCNPLLSGTADLNFTPDESCQSSTQEPEPFGSPLGLDHQFLHQLMDEDTDELQRHPTDISAEPETRLMRLPSPASSVYTSSSERLTAAANGVFEVSIPKELSFPHGSPEMLTLLFDRQTCGILSVKDGPTENPWRTLVWPLARESPALYHAISSMTCFHLCKNAPELRIHGIEHMRSSISTLVSGLRDMHLDSAIATTLVLAFAESWDQDTTTGINHIKGARTLVSGALQRYAAEVNSQLSSGLPMLASPQLSIVSRSKDEVARLRFLCNTWIYMDVIARLTSMDDDESTDFAQVSYLMSSLNIDNNAVLDPAGPESVHPEAIANTNVDPLMGCAKSLFPTIGLVANLVRRVRRMSSISPTIITEALRLKHQLESWEPPELFEAPEDPSLSPVHSIQTSEAYRWATLLYLHQAVPEIPSLSTDELAKKTLNFIATVPLTSRAVIVQIFPLCAAGCEASTAEDRQWVLERWDSMGRRMVIGVIDRCKEVVMEVWRRRDAYEESRRTIRALKIPELGLRESQGHDKPRYLEASSWGLGGLGTDPVVSSFDGGTLMGGATNANMGKRRLVNNAAKAGNHLRSSQCNRHEQIQRGMRSPPSGIESVERLDLHYTVNGRLHWLGVMKDWNWEILLG